MIDPDLAVFIVYVQEVILIVASALILVGAAAIMSYFYAATIQKRLEARISRLERALGGIKEIVEGVDRILDTPTDTHPHTPTDTGTPRDAGQKLDGHE